MGKTIGRSAPSLALRARHVTGAKELRLAASAQLLHPTLLPMVARVSEVPLAPMLNTIKFPFLFLKIGGVRPKGHIVSFGEIYIF
jgi:hypothetical protein